MIFVDSTFYFYLTPALLPSILMGLFKGLSVLAWFTNHVCSCPQIKADLT